MAIQSGTHLGPYEILAAIGAGGMGEVYRARDTRLDRIVALKILANRLSNRSELRERFEREARSIASLNHPHICALYDIGHQDGTDYLVMECLEGETLAQKLIKGPLQLDQVSRYGIEICDALSAAHRKGIIHRDLKPGNIMLTDTGAKLLDFGLARRERPASVDGETITALTGEGQILGTLLYMSPEQLQAKEVDARGDIFAFGAVLYEMLTGRKAFQRQSSFDTMAAIDREEPQPIREFAKDVPEELERIVRRCLRKRPEDRYASMSEIKQELEDCALASGITSGINLRTLFLRSKRPRIAIPALLILLALAGLCVLWFLHSSGARWARNDAVPQIAKLVEEEKVDDAYALAVQAERYIPDDPILRKFWPDISWTASINTTPTGVTVYRRKYNAPDSAWEFVGRTPIENRRFPQTDSQWKFQLRGYTTVERATFPADSLNVTMNEESEAPAGMVHVELSASPSGSKTVSLYGRPGFDALPGVPVTNFWMDRFEVTNAEYKRFVDQGGYHKQEYWKQEFRKDGQVLSWAEAMKLFSDKTGRPGPATWIQGEYLPGQDDYPVTGVSWFEAAAYAEFVGKSLPTIYHWVAAVEPRNGESMLPASNFSGVGLARVGSYHGMSWSGAYDMAGNVKEWVFNEASSGGRYIMGGAWNEPAYTFYDPDARSPFDRSPNFGLRCAKYVLAGESAKATDLVTVKLRDYRSEKPVSDQLFRVYKSLYSYDKGPLHAAVEPLQETSYWKEEKVTFDAAYGGERVIAYLFLPKRTSPPFQAVVHFTGAAALYERSSANLNDYLGSFDFIIKSGRAVLFPVYKGTFERWDDFTSHPRSSSFYRDHIIAWSKDLGRSIDYLETRPDIDHNELAYEGVSFGAALGALLPALEDRLKALVLVSPGLWLFKRLPEADQLNFAPRVKTPALMLNGRFDFVFPVNSSQEPMFRLLGTPNENKRRVVYDSGHDIPRSEMIKETLNWLDKYLGPVK